MQRKVINKELSQILPTPTSHNVGEKKVMISLHEISSPITQIARTRLLAGTNVVEHIHPTMEEHFMVLSGECDIIVDGESYLCKEGSYLYVPEKVIHSIYIITDTELITIGVAKE